MLYLIPLIIIAVCYFIFLKIGGDKSYSKYENLRKTRFDNTWWMLFSLLATNFTITGGIVASISGSNYYGIWFLVAPLTAAVGFFVFSLYYQRLAKNNSHQNKFFFTDINSNIKSPIMICFGLSSVAIAICLAGWEIYIASKAIVIFYHNIPLISSNIFAISLALASLAGYYTLKGGWDRSVLTDILQVIGVLCFLGLLCYTFIINGESSEFVKFPENISRLSIMLFVLALLVNNIGFSLVSPNNWQIAQSAQQKTPAIFITGAILLFLFSMFIYILSCYMPNGNPFGIFSHYSITSALLVSAIPLFVWSTIDTSSVAMSHIANDLLTQYAPKHNENDLLLEDMSKYYPLIFLVSAVLIAFLLNVFNPNIFNSLLAATSAIIIFIPIIFAKLFTKNINYFNSKIFAIFMFLLFVSVLAASTYMAIIGKGEYIFGVALAGLLTSFVSLIIVNKKTYEVTN